MTRLLLVALALAATPSLADVTVKATGSGGGFGMTSGMTTTTYIKGNKMRTDTVVGGVTHSMILDLDAQRLVSFDSKKREAEAWDMRAFNAALAENVDMSGMTASVTPNGRTKQIAGKTAKGYDIEIHVPATMGGEGGMKMDVALTGPTWIVEDAPGSADYARFYKAAADKGFIFSDPKAAKAQPGNAKAIAEMYRALAATGGIPFETETSMKMSGGEGPMAGIMGRMGGVVSRTTVTSVDTAKLANELFAPPAGYRVNEQRAVGR